MVASTPSTLNLVLQILAQTPKRVVLGSLLKAKEPAHNQVLQKPAGLNLWNPTVSPRRVTFFYYSPSKTHFPERISQNKVSLFLGHPELKDFKTNYLAS